ncbi:serine/threonine protein kinase, partial [Streptomyces sp. NPDC059720]
LACGGLVLTPPAPGPAPRGGGALGGAPAEPPAPQPTQPLRVAGPADGRRGARIGRTGWIGLGAAVVAAAVTAYLVVADPFAGPLPDGWKIRQEKALGAGVAVPQDYQRTVPDGESDDEHWVRYTDWSGSIWIGLRLYKKAEDTAGAIAGSAAAEMYDDDSKFKKSGDYDLDMPENPERTNPVTTTYRGRKAAENTVVYVTDDTQNPRPVELRIFYYRTTGGDMYKLTVGYPGKGDFTDRGRQVAGEAIENLDLNGT